MDQLVLDQLREIETQLKELEPVMRTDRNALSMIEVRVGFLKSLCMVHFARPNVPQQNLASRNADDPAAPDTRQSDPGGT